MLGRQGWRLLNFENSLVGCVFKAKYYPHSNFLEAKLGRNPSYVWRSILESQTLLKRGARWKIGDGRSISVIGQPWLLEAQNPFITTQHIALQGVTVHNLFKTNTREWDEDIIEDLFIDRDRRAIYDIVLCMNQYIDTRYWLFEQSGHYTVKSAYKLLQSVHGRWDVNDDAKLWRSLWKLQVPEKVKVFLWRALNSCLPMKCNLQSRMVQIDDVCSLCGVDKETTAHCFIHCLFAKSCWYIVCPEANFDSSMNITTWFLYVREHLNEKVATISMVCWSIWRARNDVVWNNRNSRAVNVVTAAIAYLTQWKDVQKLGKTNPPRSVHSTGSTERWSKPEIGCVKVNCDATLFKSSSQFGVGWITRDDKEELVYAASLSFKGKPEVHHAEAVGIREALSWIKAEIDSNEGSNDHNLQHRVLVESDCQIAVNDVLKQEKIYSPFGGIVDECRSILESYNNIDIVFVKRSGNKAADWLASSSSSNPGCIFRGEYVPPDLKCILEDDLK